MKKVRIPNAEVQELLSGKKISYPKYSTQIINLANQNAQGTRPKVVGQMSDLIQEFAGSSMKEWEEWYLSTNPGAIDRATEKILPMVENLKKEINNIDRDLIRTWVEEFLITKTFAGLKFQGAIIRKIAESLNQSYRLSQPDEESKGIDGYIGDKAVSVKPITYQTKSGLNEVIDVPIIFYKKTKAAISITYEASDFE